MNNRIALSFSVALLASACGGDAESGSKLGDSSSGSEGNASQAETSDGKADPSRSREDIEDKKDDSSNGGESSMGGTSLTGGGGVQEPKEGLAGGAHSTSDLDSNSGGTGTSVGDGGQGSGGEDASTGGSQAAASCGITKRFALPDVPRRPLVADIVRRVAGEFAVGPWHGPDATGETILNWLRVDLDAGVQRSFSTEVTLAGPSGLLNMAPPNRAVYVGDTGLGIGVIYLDEGDADYIIAPNPVIDVNITAHVNILAGVSLDGERGLVAHPTGNTPVAMFSPDGEPVGQKIEFNSYGDCETIFPTDHGVIYSQLEDSGMVLREIDATGALTREITLDIDKNHSCPLLALSADGFSVLTRDTQALYRVAPDGSSTIESWKELGDHPRAFAVDGDSAIALNHSSQDPTIVWRKGGQTRFFPVQLDGVLHPIASEAGKLFIHLSPPAASSNIVGEIIEIECKE